MSVSIYVASDDRTVRFAADELSRYLTTATGRKVDVVADCSAPLTVGLPKDVGATVPSGVGSDDWISIQGSRDNGFVMTGANPRSVLFAVYRYLHELGIRWLRPGERGELVPHIDSPLHDALSIDEQPSYRYRTICIEGSTSREHVLDLIDWMAKQGMNGYFIQFKHGTIFFKRWYEHRDNPYMQPEPFSQAELEATSQQIIDAVKLRGMSFEHMGHGWTCEAIGVSSEGGWDIQEHPDIPADKRDWLALVNGERKPFGGIMLNTNLDYSRPDVRSAVVDAIVRYCKTNHACDLLHFWLADGSNNHDEGPASQRCRPADWYVDMLNELDEKLTAANLPTRVVFLIYVDLLWPPTRATIKHPERFTLMFAPITRTYNQSLLDAVASGGEGMSPFSLNKLTMPKSAASNVAYLRAWQEQFKGDGFDYDYHAIWACYYDPNMVTIARTLHRDIQGLSEIGLSGLNSVQNQRISFPHNLLMDVMARTLWDKSLSFADISSASFADAFGEAGSKARVFFETGSRLWEPFFEAVYLPAADEARIASGKANMTKLHELVANARPLVREAFAADHPYAVAWSWRYFDAYLDMLERALPAFEGYLSGDVSCLDKFERLFDWLTSQEAELHPALDAFSMIKVMQWRVNEFKQHYGVKATGRAKVEGGGAETQT